MNTPDGSRSGKGIDPSATGGREFSPDPLPLIALGLAVFPLPRNGKVPTLLDWPNRCASDAEVIRRCWPEGSNIGVGCKANQLLGVDLDRHHEDADGIATFSALCEEHAEFWPATLTVRTPSGGLHLYFRAPLGRPLGNSQGKLGPGVDTRGPGKGTDGGYLVGPGSLVDGTPYTIARQLPIAQAPGWLVELLDPPLPPPSAGRPATLPVVSDRYARLVLKEEVERVMGAAAGARNAELNKAAYYLGKLVGGGMLDRGTAEQALYDAAAAIGLEDDRNCGPRQIRATITSGLNAGVARPRVVARRSA